LLFFWLCLCGTDERIGRDRQTHWKDALFDQLRKPFFIVALVCMALAVLVDLGAISIVVQHVPTTAAIDAPRPGRGIPTMALLDLLVLFAATLMGVALIVPERIQGRVQGLISLIFSALLLIACVVTLWSEFLLLSLMLGLLLSVPFGSIVYFASYAFFAIAPARAALSIILLLKLGFAISLVLAQQRFLQNKGLVLVIVTSLAANLLLAFLHSFVPGFLVSITDDVGGILICILAIVWSVVYLIGGIFSVVKAIV
jgi:hypothetical protein